MGSLTDLVSAVVILAILGVCVWFIEQKVPMNDTFKLLIRIVVGLGCALWLLRWAGLWHGLPS